MPIPLIPSPIWGVNWSDSDRLLVLGGSGLLELTLAPVAGLRTLASVDDLRRLFDPSRDCALSWGGRRYPIDGPNGCGPGRVSPSGERLELHPEEDDTLAVMDAGGEVVHQVLDRFLVSGGRWSVADFTPDYRYIVVFDPNELRVFRPAPDAEPGAAADPAS